MSDILTDVLFMSARSIGGIIPDVVIEEDHVDTLAITEHPVELGSAVTDNAYKQQPELTMRMGWSDSSLLVDSIVSGSIFTGDIGSTSDLYDQFLTLQESRVPFDVTTGKRTYKNMLIKQLRCTTNRETENALVLTVMLKGILIVSTTTTALKPDADHADPKSTGSVQDAGTKQPVKAKTQSALSALFGS